MKVAFIIGHNQNDKGLFSEHLKCAEWDFYTQLSPRLETIGDIYIHDSGITSYTQRCKDISERIGTKYDVVFALHFNGFNGSANGCEAFYWHTNGQSKDIAHSFVHKFTESTGISLRGAKKYTSKNERGAGEVYYPRASAILLEPFFGDNQEDCDKFDACKFIDAIRESLFSIRGLYYF